MKKLVYKTDSSTLTIKVADGYQFHTTIKSLGLPNGKKDTVVRIFNDLVSGKRKSAYGWKLA